VLKTRSNRSSTAVELAITQLPGTASLVSEKPERKPVRMTTCALLQQLNKGGRVRHQWQRTSSEWESGAMPFDVRRQGIQLLTVSAEFLAA